MKKVSVIMPTYNNGTALSRSIDSVMNQTMDKTQFELLIIDDHSNDDETIRVIKSYQQRYGSCIRFKRLRKNSGNASAPRNSGIKMSRGEYIFFLDSDDYLHTRTLEDLYTYGKANHSDMVVGRYAVEGEGRGVPKDIRKRKCS